MLQQYTINDPGSATPGVPLSGPYTTSTPLTINELGLQELFVDEDVYLADAICDNNGAVPTQKHALVIYIDDLTKVAAIIYSTQVPPNSQQRTVPAFAVGAGHRLYFKAVQLSEPSTAAAEAVTWTLMFAPL